MNMLFFNTNIIYANMDRSVYLTLPNSTNIKHVGLFV